MRCMLSTGDTLQTGPRAARFPRENGRAGGYKGRHMQSEIPGGAELSQQTHWLIAVRDSGDRSAFASLFDFYAPRLRAMMLRSGVKGNAADDLVQDVMLTVWRKAGQFDAARAQASTWIYRIARNRQIDVARRENRPLPDDLLHDEEVEPDAAQALALDQETRRLRAALDALSPEQRAMIEDAYLGELTHSEIRQKTGLPLGTIKSRIRLGLERLRHELKELR